MKLPTMLAVAAVLAVATPSVAQDAADLGIFFDPGATQGTTSVNPYQPFDCYVLTFDVGDISAFEFEVLYDQGPGLTVLERNFNDGALNVGSQDNYIVGMGSCYNGSGWFQLVHFQAGFFNGNNPDDFTLCLAPSRPSSFPNDPRPGYVDCSDNLAVFGVAQTGGSNYPDGCAVVNPTSEGPVAAESSSVGALKASF